MVLNIYRYNFRCVCVCVCYTHIVPRSTEKTLEWLWNYQEALWFGRQIKQESRSSEIRTKMSNSGHIVVCVCVLTCLCLSVSIWKM